MNKYKLTIMISIVALLIGIAPGQSLANQCFFEPSKSVSILRSDLKGASRGPSIEASAAGDLNFRLTSSSEANVDLDSVSIHYGIFNITKRVKERIGDITSNMTVSADILPAGKYKISIRAKDTAGRQAKLKLTIAVADRAPQVCAA